MIFSDNTTVFCFFFGLGATLPIFGIIFVLIGEEEETKSQRLSIVLLRLQRQKELTFAKKQQKGHTDAKIVSMRKYTTNCYFAAVILFLYSPGF